MHRFVWDLHEALPAELARPNPFREPTGPWAAPGRYSVVLTAAGRTWTQALTLARDPRIAASDADLVRQHDLARAIQSERVRVAVALKQASALRSQMASARPKAAGGASAALDTLAQAIDRAAGPPVLFPGEEFFDGEEIPATTLRRLSTALAAMQSAVESADRAPSPDAAAGFDARRAMAEEALARWQGVLAGDLPRANSTLGAAGLPALEPK